MNVKTCVVPLAVSATLACTPAPEPELLVPERVENTELGIAIAALPAVFRVVTADGPTLEFEAEGVGGAGRAIIAAGPEDPFGINLVEVVKARKAEFEAAPGGEYFGNRELGSPIGTAFTARGAYDDGGTRVEETWAYAIHPSGNRLLTITYSYPPGEAETRVEHLLELLGEIEAF